MRKKGVYDGIFLRRLGELLGKGYSLTEAIDFLFIHHGEGQSEEKKNMMSELVNGSSLSEALESHGLPPHVCSQIYFAERHGSMSETLIQAGDYLIAKRKDRESLRKVLTYPAILLIILLLLIVLLKKALFPQFLSLYESLGYTPDSALLFFLQFVDFLPVLVFVTFLSLLLLVSILHFRFQSYTPLRKTELLVGLPFVSRYLKLLYTQFLSRELSYLLKSGMSINQALKEVENQPFRPLFKETAERMIQSLRTGKSFPESLETFHIFTNEFIKVVEHGERRGQLHQELFIYSEYCLASLEQSGKKIITLIQPVVFSFVGGFILLIYFSIMMPLFKVMQTFQ